MRPTFSVPSISNQREETVRSSEEKAILSKFDDGIQTQGEVGDEYMRFEVHQAGRRDENAVRTRLNKKLGVRIVEADDIAGEGRWRVDKIPIIL